MAIVGSLERELTMLCRVKFHFVMLKYELFDYVVIFMVVCYVFQTDAASSPIPAFMRDVAVDTADAAVITEPDCLGPCEPGTAVTLEGIVWQETENGMLVVNVTWRGKTYVGTLLDATRHDWAPPRYEPRW